MGLLRTAGLSLYEARAYAVLCSSPPLTVSEIADLASLPRSKTYATLDRLVERDWALRREGRPLRFEAREPSNLLQQWKDDLVLEVGDAESDLMERWTTRAERVVQPVAVIDNIEQHLKKTLDMIRRAHENLTLLVRFVVPDHLERMTAALERAVRRDVRLRVIWFHGLRREIHPPLLQRLNRLGEQYEGPIPAQAVILDRKEMLLAVPSYSGDEPRPEVINGVHMNIPALATMLDNSMSVTMASMSRI